jgi:hypothetical protein
MSEHITLRLSDLNQVELESLYYAIPDTKKYELAKDTVRKHYHGVYETPAEPSANSDPVLKGRRP